MARAIALASVGHPEVRDELLAGVLRDTHGWQTALDQQQSILQEQPNQRYGTTP